MESGRTVGASRMVFKALCTGCRIALGPLAFVSMAPCEASAATLATHASVHAEGVGQAALRAEGQPWRRVAWSDLSGTRVDPGRYELRVHTNGGASGGAVEVPVCAGRGRVALDGRAVRALDAGPIVVPIGPG